MFFDDWLYKGYKLSRKNCMTFVPLVAFSALPTASSSLWLRQCHNTISGNSSLSNFQTLMSSLTLRRLHYCKIQWRLLIATHWWSHSLRNSPKLRLNIRSTQGLQFNQIQCGTVTGAASPSTLAFTKMIKVDLSPTRVDSSARTFILLLLSIILVKSFFFICEDTRPIVSTATVVLCKTRRMSMECLFFVI